MNQLINVTALVEKKPNELVASLSNEEKAVLYHAIDRKMKDFKEEAKKQLLQTTLNEIRWDPKLFNDGSCGYKIIHGGTKTQEVTTNHIDYEKAIKFALDHNFEVPMTKPQVDYEALEEQEWFQQNVASFSTKKTEIKTTKSYDQMREIK